MAFNSTTTQPDLTIAGFQRASLRFQGRLPRNRWNLLYTSLAGAFATIAVLPLVLVLA